MLPESSTSTSVLYLVVRQSLKMTPGKIAAQVGHGVGMVYEHYFQEARVALISRFHFWRSNCYRKVVLTANEDQFAALKLLADCFVVTDAGFTQVPAGSETVLAFWPMTKEQAPLELANLRCL